MPGTVPHFAFPRKYPEGGLRSCFTDKEISLPCTSCSKAHVLYHHALYMVVRDVLNKERKYKVGRRGREHRRRRWRRPARSLRRWRPGLSLAEQTACFHPCGNLIGSLFLAARSQTENFPPRLCLKVFSSGRLSLTSSSHGPNWFLPPLGLPPAAGSCIFYCLCLTAF